MAEPSRENAETAIPTGLPGPGIHVLDRFTNSYSKASSSRPTSYETHSVASQTQLESPRITGKGDPNPQVLTPPFTMMAEGRQCTYRPTITPNKHALQIFTDASIEGWGAHLDELIARATWSPPGSKLHINYLELKAVFSGFKRVPRPLLKQDSTCTNRQHHSSVIHKQGRRHEVGPTSCPTMENLDLVYQETSDSKVRHIPGRPNVVADKLSRLGQTIQTVVYPSRGLPLYAAGGIGPKIDLFATRFNNKLPLFVSPVPDPLATAVDALSRPW